MTHALGEAAEDGHNECQFQMKHLCWKCLALLGIW